MALRSWRILRIDSASAEPRGPASRDPTERFSDRVDDYVRYRPGYPAALIEHLRARAVLTQSTVVADIGAGTGISTALFLDAGCDVFAVEPNTAMRHAAEQRFGGDRTFHSVDARAETTGLAEASIDLVAAGTAFHWFEPVGAREEFKRILRGNRPVALFWNLRNGTTQFMRDYEQVLVAHCPGYANADAHRRADPATIEAFFATSPVESVAFPNAQSFDFEGLLGRVLSSSYAPKPGTHGFAPLRDALHRVFERHSTDDAVIVDYDTRLFLGFLS